MPKTDGTTYATPQGQRYEAYIASPEWAAKRREYWARYGRSCKVKGCGSSECLEVHHHTYERLGDEALTDLLGVCRVHHEEIHARHDAQERRASLTRITEEVAGFALSDLHLRPKSSNPQKRQLAKKPRKQSPATKKKQAPPPIVGKRVSVLDTVGSRERERRLNQHPKQRARVLAKGQKKANARREVIDRRAGLARAHQQAQEVARRIAAARQ